MVVGLLGFATSSRAEVACNQTFFCLEKTATPDPVTVGDPLTFTIRGYCISIPGICGYFAPPSGVTDTLPAGLEFVSASATGYGGPELGNPPQPTCSESEGTVTCAPVAYYFDTSEVAEETEVPFVATIEVIPTQCGTFTNTASLPALDQSVSEIFTVVGCEETPKSKADTKSG
jgi:hypothetical protein